MLSEKEIIELYEKYKTNFNCNFPKLIIKQKFIGQINSMIENVDKDNAYITIGKEFNCANRNKRYIESILYHEFTHISDSLLFLNKTRGEYSNIMKIYSETHASQIQLEKMINISHCENIKNDIIYNGNILTIESFLNQTKQHFLSKLYSLTDVENILIVNESDVIYDIYYFSGYLLAIKNKEIKYTPDFSNMPERYKAIVIEIIEYLSEKQCKEYDIEKIKNYHITLTTMIEEDNKKIQERKDEIKRNMVRCPKCGSTQIITGQKDYSLFSRFLGTNKTVNRCINCGYSWKPGK